MSRKEKTILVMAMIIFFSATVLFLPALGAKCSWVLAAEICEGDFDTDGDVDGSDLATFAADFGRTDCEASGLYYTKAEVDDLITNLQDQIEAMQPFLVPPGTIVMWSGLLADIPAGWALCDGTNGTPNLSEKFIMGVDISISEDPGTVGGSASHSHTVNSHAHSINLGQHRHSYGATTSTSGSHSHSMGTSGSTQVAKGIFDFSDAAPPSHTHTIYSAGGHNHSVSGSTSYATITGNTSSSSPGTNTAQNLPPYYKVAFIMKLP
jgi:hypothetical protein